MVFFNCSLSSFGNLNKYIINEDDYELIQVRLAHSVHEVNEYRSPSLQIKRAPQVQETRTLLNSSCQKALVIVLIIPSFRMGPIDMVLELRERLHMELSRLKFQRSSWRKERASPRGNTSGKSWSIGSSYICFPFRLVLSFFAVICARKDPGIPWPSTLEIFEQEITVNRDSTHRCYLCFRK
ncbi:hypothetical protein Tco_0631518 [Tanacetum coccineum]